MRLPIYTFQNPAFVDVPDPTFDGVQIVRGETGDAIPTTIGSFSSNGVNGVQGGLIVCVNSDASGANSGVFVFGGAFFTVGGVVSVVTPVGPLPMAGIGAPTSFELVINGADVDVVVTGAVGVTLIWKASFSFSHAP